MKAGPKLKGGSPLKKETIGILYQEGVRTDIPKGVDGVRFLADLPVTAGLPFVVAIGYWTQPGHLWLRCAPGWSPKCFPLVLHLGGLAEPLVWLSSATAKSLSEALASGHVTAEQIAWDRRDDEEDASRDGTTESALRSYYRAPIGSEEHLLKAVLRSGTPRPIPDKPKPKKHQNPKKGEEAA
ncbi:MAG: hypothetical protein ACYCST_15970 [Acidimicrobiales bacterium]